MLQLSKFKDVVGKGKPFALDDATFAERGAILVMAPHPDDFDEVAVTLRMFFEAGHTITLLVLTGASSGVLDSFAHPPSRENKEQIREKEQKNALQFFGLPKQNVQFLKLPEDDHGEIILDAHSRSVVRNIFEGVHPDIVSLPYGNDTNVSHQRTFQLFQENAIACKKSLLGLYHQDPKTISINIEAYMPFDEEVAEWKAKMLRFHESQHTRNMETRGYGLDERILRVNRDIAKQLAIKLPYAEGFQLGIFPAV